MFILTTLAYPAVLCVLSLGAALLVDRLGGRFLPACLLLPVGVAALIALSQLTTYVHVLAPATPYLMAACALAGLAVERTRVRELALRARRQPWPLVAAGLVYVVALAPVLLAGRPTFSSYMALSDSAVHLIGADYLIHHGQDYARLDLHNSYGQFLNAYYNSGYPSGADTLFGGSALLLGLPLIWAFQPFNAFVLACAAGPAWLLARRIGLAGAPAALAAVTALVPALVYGYELLASVKELTALSMILTLGCLVVLHRRWLGGPPRRAVPFALVAAAGLSSLGAAFGAWTVGAVAVLAALAAADLLAGRLKARALLTVAAAGALTLLIAALPTWVHLSSSLRVAGNIASTGNPGNLRAPLQAIQVLGVWLRGSYKLEPGGAALALTHVLVGITLAAAVIGAVRIARARDYPLGGWVAAMLLVWLLVSTSVTTWASAKTLMLTSPVVLLLAWGGVAALARASPRPWRVLAWLGALSIAGGVLVSDALQYHASNLAPTARYDELASLGSRFAGAGPALFTDFDEYALYQLRRLDVGGPDFVYPPAALAAVAGGYGDPVDLDRADPAALTAYPLIITRRDPTAGRPPAAYRLAWQGAYYQVWSRRPGAVAALVHARLDGTPAQQCARVGALALGARRGRLIAADAPVIVEVPLAGSSHPARWGRRRHGLVMSTPGRLSVSFLVPPGGAWQLWVQGELMPTVQIALDGRRLASLGGQLSGNSLVANTLPPLGVRLPAGPHRLTITRAGTSLAPGDGGSAVLDAVFLTPAGDAEQLASTPIAGWRALCRRPHEWVELLA